MSFFESLFQQKRKKKTSNSKNQLSKEEERLKSETQKDDNSESISLYPKTEIEKQKLVSIIASAIAAEDHPESEFVIRNIEKVNSEIKQDVVTTRTADNRHNIKQEFKIRRILKIK